MLTDLLIRLNQVASAIGGLVLAPVAWLPGWLSATLIGIVTGVFMLIVFKYTSNQTAIKETRAKIKANMLGLSLFKDNLWVSLRCQGRLILGAIMLMVHSLIPMAILTIPMVLMLGQIALWYQARPLEKGDESIVTVMLHKESGDAIDNIEMNSSDAARVVAGPVRVPGKNMICWNLRTAKAGRHQLTFNVNDQTYEKQLVVGGPFQPTSIKRPGHHWTDLLIHPLESPFSTDSTVQSIEITYPERDAFTCGTNNWIIYWFIVSMVAAFVAKPFLNVNI